MLVNWALVYQLTAAICDNVRANLCALCLVTRKPS